MVPQLVCLQYFQEKYVTQSLQELVPISTIPYTICKDTDLEDLRLLYHLPKNSPKLFLERKLGKNNMLTVFNELKSIHPADSQTRQQGKINMM